MKQVDRLEQLLQGVDSGADETVVTSATELLELGELGCPAGTYLLAGGKAALRLGRLADAVVLLYHGLRVAEPNTKVWADLLVNRATACSQHGFYRDAIASGEQFLQLAAQLPAETSPFLPYAHHAVAFAYDRLKDFGRAATHYRMAVYLYQDPIQRSIATCDLAYALVFSGALRDAELVLSEVVESDNAYASFVLACTTTVVRFYQARLSDALAASQRAEGLALGKEQLWANPLAELAYWQSRVVWELGDRHRSAALAFRAAVAADQLWNLDLRDTASDWLAEIMDKGGIHGA